MRAIVFQGEPKSTQHIYKMTCRGRFASFYMTAEGKNIKKGYQLEAKTQWGIGALDCPIRMHVKYYFSTKHKRDLDNMNKLVLDALTGIVYKDDSQIDELHLYRCYDAERPRIEISI